jgi:6-methylsalicylate decarboxylase
MSNGRIDVHFHIVPNFYREAIQAAGVGPARGAFPDWSAEASLELMQARGIATAITSVTYPGVQVLAPAAAAAMARRCNEFSSQLVREHPGRFGAFALIPMHDMRAAVAEIEYALDVLGHDGVCLLTSYGDRYLGDPAFDAALEALDARGAVVFIHPTWSPAGKQAGLLPGFVIEYPFDTTRAAANLIFSGALDRFPRIRYILSHAGGTLPFLAWRLSISPLIAPKALPMSAESVLSGVRRFWYDIALSPTPTAIRALQEFAQPERILFGSDWPYANATVVEQAETIYEQPGVLDAAQRAAIDRGNALALFPRLAQGSAR